MIPRRWPDMAWADILLNSVYVIIGAVFFFLGFRMVKKSLEKVNTIEGEPFRMSDYAIAVLFGVMFALAVVFAVNLAIEAVSPVPVPSVAGFVLLVLFGILLVYPLWEMLVLARPRSEAVTDYHKFLEQEIVDKVKGKPGYVVAFFLYLLTYIIPVLVFDLLLGYSFFQLLFVWTLIIPLFFLNYFAASGQAANIVRAAYKTNFNIRLRKLQSPLAPLLNMVKLVIVLVPFFLACYNFINPLLSIQDGFEQKSQLTAYLSLFTSVVFGIQGFFTRFWNKKTKTKATDFLFSGYIMVAIGVNLLISFITIDPTIVSSTVGFEVAGVQPLGELVPIFGDYAFLVPLIILQSAISVIYGLIVMFNKNSRFQANIRLGALNTAFTFPTDKDLIKLKAKIGKMEARLAKEKNDEKKAKLAGKIATSRVGTKQPDYIVLVKSVLLPPAFDKYGVDINEETRIKAGQFIGALDIDVHKKLKDVVTLLINKEVKKAGGYLSKEAFDALGLAGKQSGALSRQILDAFVGALPDADLTKKRYIMDALGDIGEIEGNTELIIDQNILDRMLSLGDKSFEAKTAAIQAIVEMGMKAKNVSVVIDRLFTILDAARGSKQPYSEYIVESVLDSLQKLVVRQPDKINAGRILPFLDYTPNTGDAETLNYILHATLKILAFLAHHQPDKIPVERVRSLASDPARPFIRYVACEVLGNIVLHEPNDEILTFLVNASLHDPNTDVRDIANESITEYCIKTKGRSETVKIDGKPVLVIDHYMAMLDAPDRQVAENASEALKTLAAQFDVDVIERLEAKIQGSNEELARDCIATLATLSTGMKARVNTGLLYAKLDSSREALTKAEILRALGFLSDTVKVDVAKIGKFIDNKQDPAVRLNAIFALGLAGKTQPKDAIPFLLDHLDEMDLESSSQELSVTYEALGTIGEFHPYNEVITALEHGLLGDTNPFIKDVIAKEICDVAHGMMLRADVGSAVNLDGGIPDKKSVLKARFEPGAMDYLPGNLVMIFLDALQMKGLPLAVLNVVNDGLQDMLPYFIVRPRDRVSNQKTRFTYLNTLQSFLVQAYNSNFSHEILETIDRVASLKAFKLYVDEPADNAFKRGSKVLAMEYTPDGKQFYDQGMLFKGLGEAKYAIASFEISLEMSSNALYTPVCLLELGMLVAASGNKDQARVSFEKAAALFTFYDDIANLKRCEDEIEKLG